MATRYCVYCALGVLLTLCLFLLLIVLAVRNIGTLLRVSGQSSEKQVLAWSLGVALLVHVLSFMAVSYFGQIIVLWYLTLAMIASVQHVSLTRSEPSSLGIGKVNGGHKIHRLRPTA